MTRPRTYLERSPLLTAVTYTVLGVLPLYLMSAQSILIQRSLGFGPSTFGFLVASFFLMSSVAVRGLGPWVDRSGPTPALRAAALLTGATGLLSLTVVRGWPALVVVMALGGLGNALAQLGGTSVIAGGIDRTRHGISLSAKQAAVPLAAVLGGALVPIIGLSDWRPAFGVALAVGIAMAVLAPRYPAPVRTPASPSPGDEGGSTGSRWDPEVLALMGAGACAGGIGNGLASFTPNAAVAAGFSPATAAVLLTAGSGVAIVARVGAGWIVDRRDGTGATETMLLFVLGVMGLVGLTFSGGSRTVFLIALLVTFAGAWGWPGVLMVTSLRILRLPAATAAGAVAAGSYLGTVIVPILMGIIIEERSYVAVFAGQSVLLLIAALLVLLGSTIARRRDGRSPVARA